MGSWAEFAAATGLFFASHLLPQATGLKPRLAQVLGRRGYLLAYSLVSVALLAWAVAAAGRAPVVPLLDQAHWHRVAANLLMPCALALAVFGIGAPNPFAFEGRAAGFDPARPGIAGLTRQPLLWALAIWAGVHLLANGDLAHVALFLPLFVLAAGGIALAERSARRRLGAYWTRLSARTGVLPLAAAFRGRWRPRHPPPGGRLALALALWAALWHLHQPVIGVWPGF